MLCVSATKVTIRIHVHRRITLKFSLQKRCLEGGLITLTHWVKTDYSREEKNYSKKTYDCMHSAGSLLGKPGKNVLHFFPAFSLAETVLKSC